MGFLQYLYFWPGHDIAAHYHTTLDAMALFKEKSIFILSIVDIFGGKLLNGLQDNCKMEHLREMGNGWSQAKSFV